MFRNTCSCGKPKFRGLDICEDCYEELFSSLDLLKEEPDFVLKYDGTAKITMVDPTLITAKIGIPKGYRFEGKAMNIDDLNLLMFALLQNVTFYDTHPMFDKIKHLLKEVK